VLDLGRGNGAQTLELARHIKSGILAVDIHQPYLDELERRARAQGLAERIKTRNQDMAELEPQDGPFDLIWAEGHK
jgi:cyclopropane fatty-acyl-phospholipid synthase-like methyltransferase